MKIGDKVSFLSEIGGGRVAGFQGRDIVLVEDEDGFQIPMPVSDVVVTSTGNDYSISKVVGAAKKTGETACESDGIELTFPEDTLDYIVSKAMEYKLGSRGLRSIVETVMMDAMYEIPSKRVKKFNVTLDYAKQQLDKAHLQKLESA